MVTFPEESNRNYLNKLLGLSASLEDADTRFFILDTKGATSQNNYQDQDFVAYHWSSRQFNKMREGDWFIYRRPVSASHLGQFYFFGAGQIAHIEQGADGDRYAKIVHPFVFPHYLLANDDLKDFKWHFKTRARDDWMYFFNQYGMTQINGEDFSALLSLAGGQSSETNFIQEGATTYRAIAQGQYAVTERSGLQIQRVGQNVLAEVVRANYGFKCAVTSIHTREFLVASHIIPWRVSVEKRLDPHNVICLSSLWDRAFDQGYITFDANDLHIRVSPRVREDPALAAELLPFEGRQLKQPNAGEPDKDALMYHNEEVFHQR